MNTSPSIHFLNGEFVEDKDLVVSIRDLGFARGFAVFDFLVTYQQKPFLLDMHIDRLYNSASAIHLSLPWDKAQVTEWVHQTLAKNSTPEEKGIKIYASGGISDSLLPDPSKTTLAILVDPRHYLPESFYTDGVGVITVKHTRYQPEAKTNNYIEAVKQVQIAKEIHAIEPVYHDDTQVFEGSNSNIFAVINGKVLTPKTNILAGITKHALMHKVKTDIEITEEDFSVKQLKAASEIFFTGSNKEVLPITKIDGESVADGKPGPITQKLMSAFFDFTKLGSW